MQLTYKIYRHRSQMSDAILKYQQLNKFLNKRARTTSTS